MELLGRRKDASTFPVEISLSPLVSQEGLRVIVTVRDVTQRKRLRDFGAGALQASEDERLRISRELHDGTAQELATLLLRLRVMERGLTDEGLVTRLRELRETVVAAAEGVRRIARGLRPPELEDAGLTAALQAHVRSVREGTGMDVRLDSDAVDAFLDADQRLVLYRVVQEAISNAVRHSGASAIEIRVSRQRTAVVATVADQGRGFASGEEARRGGGLGILGMEERAVMAGGRVRIDSEPGQGALVTLELPCRPAGA
jgi:two-component system sensor histidine kinase UhpB